MSRVLEANSVTILPTNRCTAACRHCSMNAGPDRQDTLSWPELEHIINQLFDQLANLDLVVFSGGEATMLGADLHQAIRLCKQRNPKVLVRLVTNAFWATSPEAADQTLRLLKDAGLDELNVSTDDYHLPYVSLQRVRNAWEAAAKMNFVSIALSNAYGPESWLTPERVESEFRGGFDMQRRFGEDGYGAFQFHWDKLNVVLSNMPLNRLGRKKDKLFSNEVKVIDEQLGEIGDMMSGCPWAIRSAAVSAKGHLVSCCGFEVEDNPILDYGSILEHPLDELLDKADNDLISNMIAIIGPPQLKRILEGIAPDEISFPRESYSSYCEVCEDLVGIEQNRQALYKYQALFFDTVSDIRDEYAARYTRPDGTIVIPNGKRLTFKFEVIDHEDEDGEAGQSRASNSEVGDRAQPRRSAPRSPRLIPLSRLTRKDDEPAPAPPSPCRAR